MEDLVSAKVSATMRNAINVNTLKTHQLEKQVKSLEVERDLRLMNLQIERDEMFFGSPSTRRKLAKSPTVSDGVRTPVTQLDIFDFESGLFKDKEPIRHQKAGNLPPLHLDQAGVIATPPRVRKAIIRPSKSPRPLPLSLLESSAPSHKHLARQSSSPLMFSSVANSAANAKDTLRQKNTLESKHQLSPRFWGSSVVTPASPGSPGLFKFDLGNNSHVQNPQRPVTPVASSSNDNGKEVHRGLLLRPVPSSKEQTKPKEKKESVFNRLYLRGKKRD